MSNYTVWYKDGALHYVSPDSGDAGTVAVAHDEATARAEKLIASLEVADRANVVEWVGSPSTELLAVYADLTGSGESEIMGRRALAQLRESQHLCRVCLVAPACTIAQAIAKAEPMLPCLNACLGFTHKDDDDRP